MNNIEEFFYSCPKKSSMLLTNFSQYSSALVCKKTFKLGSAEKVEIVAM